MPLLVTRGERECFQAFCAWCFWKGPVESDGDVAHARLRQHWKENKECGRRYGPRDHERADT